MNVMTTSRQYWTLGPGRSEVQNAAIPEPGSGEVLIRTEASGISPGTETLVHSGKVPASIQDFMRAPQQLGDLPGPVSHGYLNIGFVQQGPEELVGRRVFTLAGHREHIMISAQDCHTVEASVPTARALLAGIAEVGLNALWEAQASLGERIAVVGEGLVGVVTGLLAQRLTPSRLEVLDPDPIRRQLAENAGLNAVDPHDAAADCDVVIHTSATESGLARSLEIAGDDAVIIEASWYGDHTPQVPLGADFHARRLRLLSTQVSEVAAPMRLRRSRRERLATALSLLDERFDAVVTGHSPVENLPQVIDDFAAGAEWTREQLLHVVTYD